MALLDALGTYLQTQGQGTLGTTIMLSQQPDEPDACVTLFEAAGLGPMHVMGSAVYGVDRPRVRVWCRAGANDYPTARAKAEAVRNVLGAVRDVTLSSVNILSIQTTSEIYPVRFDIDDRPILACDYVVWVRP